MSERFGAKHERREDVPEKLIVEVGSGSLPLFTDSQSEYRDTFDGSSARYIGIDLDFSELTHGKELQSRSDADAGRETNKNISYVQAKAEALPLRNESVDEFLLRNVLGDPDIPVEEKRKAINEAARVMKPGGILKIIEVYTPLMVYEDEMFEYIGGMEGRPFEELTEAEIERIPAVERSNDEHLSRDEAAADTFFGNQSFVRRYKRV